MYNWSVDTSRLRKYPAKFKIFKLEQAINFGLNDTKLSKKDLKKYFNILEIDPHKKKFLGSLIWEK